MPLLGLGPRLGLGRRRWEEVDTVEKQNSLRMIHQDESNKNRCLAEGQRSRRSSLWDESRI